MKQVFLTGGTGFVGRAIVGKLSDRPDVRIHLLTRSEDALKPLGPLANRVVPVHGDVLDSSSLEQGLVGMDVVIHLVGIIRESGEQTFERIHIEGTRQVVEAAKKAGVRRFIHMSAENARPDAPDRYHKTKFKAEEMIRASGLDWTIIRPSMIFGREDRNFNDLARIIRLSPVVPVIGDGLYVWQPIAIDDVAKVFAGSVFLEASIGKTYELRGPEKFTFNEILDLIMDVTGMTKPTVHVPSSLMSPIVSLLSVVPGLAPITPEQMKMLLDKTPPPPENFTGDFPIRLKRLEEGLREYLLPGTDR